jgi:hypothetical protein
MAEIVFPYTVRTEIVDESDNHLRAFEWCHKNIGQSTFYKNEARVTDGAWSVICDLSGIYAFLTFRFKNKQDAMYFKLWVQGLDDNDNVPKEDWRTRLLRKHPVNTGFKPGQLHILASGKKR